MLFYFTRCKNDFAFVLFAETPLWLLLQVAPIRNERDLVVLLLLTFRDITPIKQLIDAEDTKSGNFHRRHSVDSQIHQRLIRSILLSFMQISSPLPTIGLSKFAKLARSVTRSRQFAAHIPNPKDPAKQSNLPQVNKHIYHFDK